MSKIYKDIPRYTKRQRGRPAKRRGRPARPRRRSRAGPAKPWDPRALDAQDSWS